MEQRRHQQSGPVLSQRKNSGYCGSGKADVVGMAIRTAWFVMFLAFVRTSTAQDAQTISTATGITSGLAVVIGTTDGVLESDLASTSLMVQGISTDPAAVAKARREIALSGKFPLANATWVAEYKRLPYAHILSNLIVVDLDKLGAAGPSLDEIKRILGYNGKAYVKQGGTWKTVANPKPADVDEWPYQFYDEKRRFESKDSRAGLWSGLKWIAGPRKKSTDNDFRIQDGQVYMYRMLRSGDKKNTNLPLNGTFYYLMARDAFSGTLLWKRRLPSFQLGRVASKTGGSNIVARNGKIFAYDHQLGYLTAFDGRTGKVVKVYDQTIKPDSITSTNADNIPSHAVSYSTVFFHNGKMFQSYKNNLWMLDETTGAVIWHHKEATDTNWIWQPVPGDDGDIYSAVTAQGPEGGFKDNVDGHMAWLKAMVRINVANGEVVWRNETDVQNTMGQFIGAPNLDVVPTLLVTLKTNTDFFPAYDGIAPWVFSTKDGKLLWRKNLGQLINWTSATIAIHDAKVQIFDLYGVKVLDPLTGDYFSRITLSKDNGDNPGCMSVSMSPRFYFRGPRMTLRPSALPPYVAKGTYLQALQPMNFRPSCGEISNPAYGQLYCPGTICGCTWYLPGDVAVYAADSVIPIDLPKRKITGDDGLGGSTVTGKVDALADRGPFYEDWMMAEDIQETVKGTGWGTTALTSATLQKWNTRIVTDTVVSGDLSIRSVIHENRIEAFKGTNVVWTFLTGGRVSIAPVVKDNLVIFGCHDGWVYALKALDGSLAWRFLAAPMDRRIVAYGQVESAWPLYGVLLQDNNIYYMAGRSSGIDDGMTAGALDPATGTSKWRVRIARYDAAKYGHYINSPLAMINGKITYLGPGIDPSVPANVINGTRDEVSTSWSPRPRNRLDRLGWETAGPVKVRYLDARGRELKPYIDNERVGRSLRRSLAPGYYVAIPENGNGIKDPAPMLLLKR